jgi:zinc transporter, ZIP family
MSEMTANEMSGKSIEVPSWFSRLPSGVLAIVPAILLIGVLAVIIRTDGGLGDRTLPPIETLNVQRVTLPAPGQIEVEVINGGPDEISIAQVLVDDAYWQFTTDHEGPLGRLDSATLSIPYPWVQDEAHMIQILTSTGTIFEAEIPVAFESPEADRGSVARFALVGIYVGVIPIALGLLWYPLLTRLGRRGMAFILALTVGLLAFLVADMWEEARESSLSVAGAFDAPVMIPVLALLTTALLVTVGNALRSRTKDGSEIGGLRLAYQIAVGIGLHNLGEGLAIGSAFALGETALGVFLIVGFTLHNVTEGIGIAAPVVRKSPGLLHFVALAAVAGVPAIIGTWIGAFTYSAFWTTIFLAIGIGAILQVIWEVGRLVQRSQAKAGEPLFTWNTFGGVAAGIALMYATALLITA